MSNLIEQKIFKWINFSKGINTSAKYGALDAYKEKAVSIDNVSNATLFRAETTGKFRVDEGQNFQTKKPESLLFIEAKGQNGNVWLKVTESMKTDILAERENGYEVLSGIVVQFGILTGKTEATEKRPARDWFATFYAGIAPVLDAGNGITEGENEETEEQKAARVAAETPTA